MTEKEALPMKQQTLHQFSASALRGNSRCMHLPLIELSSIYLLYGALLLSGAWLLCTETDGSLLWVLLWCGIRLLLGTGVILLGIRCKVHLLRHCTELLHLPCDTASAAYKRMLRLALVNLLIRFLMRLSAAAGIAAAVYLLQEAAVHTDGIYWLMGAVQVIPLILGILLLRLRWGICFAAAESLCVQKSNPSAWGSLKAACSMMHGQYRFLLGILLRSLPWMLLPAMMPRCTMTWTTFFAVRHLEWQYQQPEGGTDCFEPTRIHRRNPKPHAAGGVSAP